MDKPSLESRVYRLPSVHFWFRSLGRYQAVGQLKKEGKCKVDATFLRGQDGFSPKRKMNDFNRYAGISKREVPAYLF